MESSTILAIAAVVCFVVYYEIVTASYIEHVTSNGVTVSVHCTNAPLSILAQAERNRMYCLVVVLQLSLKWLQAKGYQDWMVGTGFVIGVVSGCLCFGIVLTIGVTKQIFNRIRSRIANPFIREVLPPVIGGLVIGKICSAMVLVVFFCADDFLCSWYFGRNGQLGAPWYCG